MEVVFIFSNKNKHLFENDIDKNKQMFYNCHRNIKRPLLKRCWRTIGQVFIHILEQKRSSCILHRIILLVKFFRAILQIFQSKKKKIEYRKAVFSSKGQYIGFSADSGVGKSTLLGVFAHACIL